MPFRVLVLDDDPEVIVAPKQFLLERGNRVFGMPGIPEARKVLGDESRTIALVEHLLIDSDASKPIKAIHLDFPQADAATRDRARFSK